MKRIKKKLVAVILAITILGTGLIGSYTTVPAAEFSAGALAASETLQWITAALGAVGISISVKELLKPRQADIEKDIGKHIDWDNYDWGDALDSPAAQDQIDELDKTINKLYGNASAKWKEMYEKSLSPTPTPETSPDNPEPSPPVTVAPIDPDTVTPPDWDILKKTSMNNGYLALGAATYWCLKEAVKGLWNNIVGAGTTSDSVDYSKLEDSNYKNAAIDGLTRVGKTYSLNKSGIVGTEYYRDIYIKNSDNIICAVFWYVGNTIYIYPVTSSYNKVNFVSYVNVYRYSNYTNKTGLEVKYTGPSDWSQTSSGIWSVNLPMYDLTGRSDLNSPSKLKEYIEGSLPKDEAKKKIWVTPNLKSDYDGNKSPSLPDTSPAPAIKIPSLDEIKDLQKKGNDSDDEKRPSIIQEFVTNHYTNPTPAPEPTTAPDPDPNPTTAPNPDPNPSESPNPTTTPAVNPDISGSPKPSGTPENPDDTGTDTDVDPDNYKTDLRLVFPFCIPFDLVHLIQAFEAEPKAPVFEFPVDMELTNPFTEKKILDYHHTFELDMSDFEPVIKILRIFEIIFFIIGLLMITRQQMIKG